MLILSNEYCNTNVSQILLIYGFLSGSEVGERMIKTGQTEAKLSYFQLVYYFYTS